MKIKIASIFAVVVFAVAAACSSKPAENAAEAHDSTTVETVAPEAAPVEADTTATTADTTAAPAPAH